jgi:hypothetical protein
MREIFIKLLNQEREEPQISKIRPKIIAHLVIDLHSLTQEEAYEKIKKHVSEKKIQRNENHNRQIWNFE